VCVHVEAPDEAGHEGNPSAKVKALEEIDAKIVSPVIRYLEQQASNGEPYRVFVCPDHPTFCSTRMHTRGLVPFIIAGSGVEGVPAESYDERAAARGPIVAQGSTLISSLFEDAEA
jgi:2,3-bisphosphoglycerate-independent phosphoglycerate mutase